MDSRRSGGFRTRAGLFLKTRHSREKLLENTFTCSGRCCRLLSVLLSVTAVVRKPGGAQKEERNWRSPFRLTCCSFTLRALWCHCKYVANGWLIEACIVCWVDCIMYCNIVGCRLLVGWGLQGSELRGWNEPTIKAWQWDVHISMFNSFHN